MTDEPTPRQPLAILGELGAALAKSEQTVGRLESTLRDERANQKRFRWTLGALMALMLLMLAAVGISLRVQDDARNVAVTLEDCLIVGGDCYERLARNGQLGSNRLMDFNACLLVRLPETRDNLDVEDCKKEANDKFFKALNAAEGDGAP